MILPAAMPVPTLLPVSEPSAKSCKSASKRAFARVPVVMFPAAMPVPTLLPVSEPSARSVRSASNAWTFVPMTSSRFDLAPAAVEAPVPPSANATSVPPTV